MPKDLQPAIGEFVDYSTHKALKNLTPLDMLAGRRDQILAIRKEAKNRSWQQRKKHNKTLREQLSSA